MRHFWWFPICQICLKRVWKPGNYRHLPCVFAMKAVIQEKMISAQDKIYEAMTNLKNT